MKKTMILVLAASAVLMAQQTAPPPAPPTDIAGFDNGAEPDEPGRPVARLSVASGDVSVKRGDSAEWVAGALNAPVMEADSIAVSRQAAAEVQFDHSHYARLAGDTEIRVVQIDGGLHRIQVSKGLVTWRVLRETQVPAEISTPLVAVRPVGVAAVRVEVAQDSTTRVTVRHGEVEVQTARGSERLHEGALMIVRPARGESEYQITSVAGLDRWDTWSDQRDTYLLRATSPKYVSSDIYGAEDLDPYGRWTNDPAYGDVWVPSVPATWAPYRDGRWVWEDYYGWTWVDYQPWGWAPFHYGSWYYRTGFGWSWFPGHRGERYFWRPAMVGFFGFGGGGFGVGFGFGNVGWVPLAPYERYRPWYGRGGFGGGRNVVVNNINITNVYRNSRFGNGATAVSAGDFQRGNYRNRVAVDGNRLQQASLVRGAGMAPTNDHLRFSDRSVGTTPRTDFGNRSFFGDNRAGGTAAAARTPFAEQQAAVRGNLGGGVRQGGNAQGGDFRGYGQNQTPAARQGGNATPGWRQFGNPGQGGGGSPAPVQGQGGGQRFGGSSGSIGVNQPVVRERPNTDSGRQFGGGFGAPGPQRQQAAPQAAPQYRQPAPQYRQAAPSAQPAPQYRQAPSGSAPRESGGGGNRGGSSGGGGQRGGGSHGDGGGNRRGR